MVHTKSSFRIANNTIHFGPKNERFMTVYAMHDFLRLPLDLII